MKQLLELFFTFAKIGLFTFGGGYAMLPLIERTCVTKKHWLSDDDMLSITVMAESTPGPIAINCATFVGNRQKGFGGAMAATLGMVTPSFVMILLVSFFLEQFLAVRWVASAFQGIKIAVGILIIDAAIRLLQKLPKKPLPIAILALSSAAMLVMDILALHITSVVLLLTAAAVSFFAYLAKRNGGGAK